MELHPFTRTELLLGKEALEKLHGKKVAVFGIGGVGTFVVEGLVRAGVGKFVLIDHDVICITNINRQIHSMHSTIGRPKVEVMKERIKDINPNAEVETYQIMYNSDTAEDLLDFSYDYVVDAIDMVPSKIDLIERCYKKGIPIISSMGAGNKLDPTKVEVGDVYKTSVCPLAKVIRKELRKRNVDKLKVVYSKEEPLKPQWDKVYTGVNKKVPGSISFVPSVFGLVIASEVVKDLINR